VNSHNITLHPIGVLRSPFTSKFGLPRQSGLIQSAPAHVELLPPYNAADAVRGIDGFSHLWLIFAFHEHLDRPWQPLIRPPGLGGNTKTGVFASRSSYRPNHLGMSIVKLLHTEISERGIRLHISCPDIVSGSPIYDIKPYLAYADRIDDSNDGYAPAAPPVSLSVKFSAQAEAEIDKFPVEKYGALRELIKEVLSLDPRPPYKGDADDKVYRVALYDLDVEWCVAGREAKVLRVLTKGAAL
jgi:tRNA (adenine37-N6)-methyltransferase